MALCAEDGHCETGADLRVADVTHVPLVPLTDTLRLALEMTKDA